MITTFSIRFLLILNLFFLLYGVSAAQTTRRVLFLGNSYTYVNSLPQMLASVAASTGDALIHDSNSPGGHTFEGHSTNATSRAKIQAGNWDYVVLQEQSQRPSFPDGQVATQVFPYARVLDSLIHAYNPCGQTIFYMTWGRKNGDAGNCATWPPVCTYAGMDSLLNLRYRQLADSNNALLSPVGAVWKYLRQNHPGIELYQADESHPSVAGTYAAACCFYTAIFRKNPAFILHDAGLNAADAATIRNAAKTVVFDNLLQWHIGAQDLAATFTGSEQTGYTWQFSSTIAHATGWQWTFGAATDTAANPVFTFPDSGLHEVRLTAWNACDTVNASQWVLVRPVTAVRGDHPLAAIAVWPNPATERVQVDLHGLSGVSLGVFTPAGACVVPPQTCTSGGLPLVALPAGRYVLVFRQGNLTHAVPIDKL